MVVEVCSQTGHVCYHHRAVILSWVSEVPHKLEAGEYAHDRNSGNFEVNPIMDQPKSVRIRELQRTVEIEYSSPNT